MEKILNLILANTAQSLNDHTEGAEGRHRAALLDVMDAALKMRDTDTDQHRAALVAALDVAGNTYARDEMKGAVWTRPAARLLDPATDPDQRPALLVALAAPQS